VVSLPNNNELDLNPTLGRELEALDQILAAEGRVPGLPFLFLNLFEYRGAISPQMKNRRKNKLVKPVGREYRGLLALGSLLEGGVGHRVITAVDGTLLVEDPDGPPYCVSAGDPENPLAGLLFV